MRDRNLSRHDLGRDKFLLEVIIFFLPIAYCITSQLVSFLFIFFILQSSWQVLQWKDQHGGTILKQLRTLGASLDWSREV